MTGLILVFATPLLSSCVDGGTLATMGVGAITKDIFARNDVNLAEKNYAAADYLVQQIVTFIPKSTPIAVQPLTLVGEPAITSALGRKIPAQVGARLMQLGYNVHLDEAMPGAVQGVSIKQSKPRFILGGTYETNRRDVPINLRMVNASSGKIVGSFDYVLPRSGELRTLSESQAKIYRVSE
ncbi:MAG TPA: hypothetical protein ENJ57_02735 [Rhizobiales bacterium]|nr:hypothetical protein [Hyphomicrobiales bacterium]